ncbi:MAG: hypothetical protein FWG74_03975 [Planctomycetes bacterium]|nr:hypothetical protein [Planctomycetota bacterium]
MAKKNPKRDEQWADAKRRCRLSVEQVRRAKEMGLNPVKLIKNIPAPTQQWKQPVGDWIDEMYEKRQAKAARIEKKSTSGIATSQRDLVLLAARLCDAEMLAGGDDHA